MKVSEAYKLSMYKDYGPLGEKEHIRLVKNIKSGKICVQKIMDGIQSDIIDFRTKDLSLYFPELFEVIEDENKYIIIEEYVEGVTLEEYMMGESLSEAIAVCLTRQICEALRCLHSFEPMIIYRDLKPENIMITPELNIRLIDFDIARKYQMGKTQDTELLGTAGYAAPEQFGYFQTDNRTDIYALGILLNYMLTGRLPSEYVTQRKYGEIVRKCIELEPSRRYQSVEEVLKDLPEITSINQAEENSTHITRENQSWTIPGFRSDCLWKKILAVFGYGMIFYIGLTIGTADSELPYGVFRLWLKRSIFTILQLAAVAVSFNYRGIMDDIKIISKKYKNLNYLAYPIIAFVFTCMAAVIIAIVEIILGI